MTTTADATTSVCRHTVFVTSPEWLTASGEWITSLDRCPLFAAEWFTLLIVP